MVGGNSGECATRDYVSLTFDMSGTAEAAGRSGVRSMEGLGVMVGSELCMCRHSSAPS